MSSSHAHASHPILRGELFKAGENNPSFKLRWFELFADGVLCWSEQEGAATKDKVLLKDALITTEAVEKPKKAASDKDEARFGFRITPSGLKPGGPPVRCYSLCASSDEERRLWMEKMDEVAHSVPAFGHGAGGNVGRSVRLPGRADGNELGVQICSDPGTPCVTVCGITSSQVASAGLLVGDVIVAIENTVLRNFAVAKRAFEVYARGAVATLRLAGCNREVRVQKIAGLSGLTLVAPSLGPGVLISDVARDSAASNVGLHVGDRVLAINGTRTNHQLEQANQAIRASLQEVRLVVTGVSVATDARKDADGRLGLGFAHGPLPPGLQGAVITDVLPRSSACTAGLRSGDLLVSVDGRLVQDQNSGVVLLSTASRALKCVVWRPRADVASDAGEAGAGGAGGASSCQAGAASQSGGAADDPTAKRNRTPSGYYTHSVMPHGRIAHPEMAAGGQSVVLPVGVPLFEDLTAVRS